MSQQAIGFANKFYTLWTIETTNRYYTDPHGKHHLSGTTTTYQYHKNISTDLEKAKSLFPGLELWDDLRGKSESWQRSSPDLTPEILKFGKYAGRDMNELVKDDFNYLIWLAENGDHRVHYAREIPEVIEFLNAKEAKLNKILSDRENVFQELVKKGSIDLTVDRNLKIENWKAYFSQEIDDVYVTFIFEEGSFSQMHYDGHTYGLPKNDKGLAFRMKNKPIRITFEEVEGEVYTVKVISCNLIK